jgi:hypothetical protein
MSMEHRWSKPANTLDCVEGDAVIVMPGEKNREMVDVKVSVDEDTYERMRQGYICANCFEPQETPFPEVCHAMKLPDGTVVGCFYRMRDCQLRDMELKHGAGEEVHIGSRINRYDEMERLREIDAWEERTGMRLPPSVKFPTTTIETPKR